MAITKVRGKLYVTNINVPLFEALVEGHRTIGEFLSAVGFTYKAYKNIKEGGLVTLDTVYKILSLYPEIEPYDLILDFNEKDFVHFDIDLKKHTPTERDLKECENLIRDIVRTLRIHTERLGVEKQSNVMNLIKRLNLEVTYYGIILEKLNKSAKTISAVRDIRSK